MPPITRSAARHQIFIHKESNEVNESSFNLGSENAIGRDIQKTPRKARFAFQDVTNQSATKNKTKFHKPSPTPIKSQILLTESQWEASKVELLEEIGGGAQSRVFKGRRRDDDENNVYAVKVIDYNCNRKYADRELEIHETLDHPGVVQLHGHYRESGPSSEKLCLVLEYCPKTLQDLVKNSPDGRMPEVEAAKYIACIIKTLQYLHDNKVIHRDIKLTNILISKDGHAKIADFGISTNNRNPELRETIIGTEGYMAPEIEDNTSESKEGAAFIKAARENAGSSVFDIASDVDLFDTQYDEKVDVFSLGTTLYAMLTGKLPEDNKTSCDSDLEFCFDDSPESVFDFDFASEVLSMDALDLILGMLEEDPEQRMSLQEIEQHAWLTEQD